MWVEEEAGVMEGRNQTDCDSINRTLVSMAGFNGDTVVCFKCGCY